MDFELDHLFVCVSQGGEPEAECLLRLGLTEGDPNTHPGQGTACRRFFFANAFLELVWVCDPAEVQGEMARPLQLWERWSGRTTGACPFGVCLRPSRPGVEHLPFPSWAYRPTYLPAPLCFHVKANSSPQEPLLVYLPFGRRPDARPERQPLCHAANLREISHVVVHGPQPPADIPQQATICFQTASEPLLEVGFDREPGRLRADLRPLLPLVLVG